MKITQFQGEYRWLSNFWPALITYEGIQFKTVENAYQAAKCADPFDRFLFQKKTPGEAKRLGRRIPMRADWHDIKVSVMLSLLRDKFKDESLAKQLINTGDAELIEGNSWGDRFWGVYEGVGENNLGKLLMQVREELRNVR